MNCPLCDHDKSRSSWLQKIDYSGREYGYLQCLNCGSLFCDPMPDAQTLRQMYGPSYQQLSGDGPIEDPKEPQRTLWWLRRLKTGTFLDYGCGEGNLLVHAREMGWQAIGVELDRQVATDVARRTGARVSSEPDKLFQETGAVADVLHLGDVIEHLTALDHQLPEILRFVKPDGLLVAQGPLEANFDVFNVVVRFSRKLQPRLRTEMAPYHVLLATARGQQDLFRRFGLREVEYVVREVAWPAPSKLSWGDFKQPRSVAMFLVRRLSQAVSALRPGRWGNRYFYAGRRGHSPITPLHAQERHDDSFAPTC
jgi:SAM-dependent methyltransferase